MNPLTLQYLKDALNELTEEQLQMSASVLLDGEVWPILDCRLLSELPIRQRDGIDVDLDQPLFIL